LNDDAPAWAAMWPSATARYAVGKTPCFKVFDCWWERFDVVALSASRPQPKVASLVELIRQARERASRE
jgi:hypothetical protein